MIWISQFIHFPNEDWTSSRWQHKPFLTSVPLTRWSSISNYPETRHHCENPETGEETEEPSCIKETEKDHTIKVRGMAIFWSHCPSSRPAHCNTKQFFLSHNLSSGKKENLRGRSSFPRIAEYSLGNLLGSHFTGITGIVCNPPPLGIRHRWWRGLPRLIAISTQILTTFSITQARIPASNAVHL